MQVADFTRAIAKASHGMVDHMMKKESEIERLASEIG